jgi:prepilin-type N-terminal cleavage/methylation domain-containing protein
MGTPLHLEDSVSAELHHGMTLLEVVIAGAVISIALMGTMSAWLNSQRLQSLQREESIVQEAINKAINDMRAVPFGQIDNAQDAAAPGFSGGQYPGDVSGNRLLPGKVKLYLGWSGQGVPPDDSLRGVKVSKDPFDGGVKVGNSYWAPQSGTPEIRIIFINNEVPTEARMGEEPTRLSDGVDLNADGTISETPVTSEVLEFGDVDSTSLFPRLLAVPVSNPPRAPIDQYVNVTQLVVYPVVIQARWWSAAGFPREITVITFFTNRAGSTTATADTYVP